MQFSEAWLRSLVNPALNTQELGHLLTMAGLEVEALEPVAQAFSQVVVAEILSAEKHPNADRLQVCQVYVGGEQPLTIVCGAPNARAGIKTACALVGALTASGLPAGEFHFTGFLPHKSGQRRNALEALRPVPGTLVFYESPYRIAKLLGELNEVFPDREVVLARELTKKFEEFLRGKPAALLAIAQARNLKGEFVVLVGGAP